MRSTRRWAFLGLAAVLAGLLAPVVAISEPASASAYDCKSSAYACTPGYTASNAQGTWAWSHYGNIPGNDINTATGLHNCTLYAAWRLAQSGMGDPGNWGMASSWASHTAHDHTPAVGSIAWWGTEVAGGAGHVAYVEQVNGTQVFIRADAYVPAGGYTSAGWIDASTVDFFLHPHDSPNIGEGSVVSYAGNVYRIAGGAPLYVSNWAAIGGPQPATALSDAQWSSLRRVPADGTFLGASGGGVFRVAGGAPIYVSNWTTVGGPQSYVAIDQWDIDNTANPMAHLNSYPSDGTFVNVAAGGVYRFAGGAPLYVSSWSAVGGPQPSTLVDEFTLNHGDGGGALNHVHQHPVDGTLLAASGGGVFRVAGGAPIFVSNWSTIGGVQPYVWVDQWDIDNTANPIAHLSTYPTDGTLVNVAAGGVYRFAGGAPLYISNWANIGGQQPTTLVDEYTLDRGDGGAGLNHVHRRPANGTFLSTTGGTVYRVAGGAALPLSSCSPLAGCSPRTLIDAYAVTHAGGTGALDHLSVAPADGTVIRGLPSGTYWTIRGGHRSSTGAATGAVDVNDWTVQQLPVDYMIGYSATENARMLQSAAYFGQTPQAFPKWTVTVFDYLLAISNPRPAPTSPPSPTVTGTSAYTTTWTTAELPVLQDFQRQFNLGPVESQKFAVNLANYLLAMGGH